MHPKNGDEHAKTEVLDDDGDSMPEYDPDATAVLDEDVLEDETPGRKK